MLPVSYIYSTMMQVILLWDDNGCQIKDCSGKLLYSDSTKSVYNWAIPLKCNKCETVRFIFCKICSSESNCPNKRLGVNSLIIKYRLWKHNESHDKNTKQPENIVNINSNSITSSIMSPTSNIDGAQNCKAPLSKRIKLDDAPTCEE